MILWCIGCLLLTYCLLLACACQRCEICGMPCQPKLLNLFCQLVTSHKECERYALSICQPAIEIVLAKLFHRNLFWQLVTFTIIFCTLFTHVKYDMTCVYKAISIQIIILLWNWQTFHFQLLPLSAYCLCAEFKFLFIAVKIMWQIGRSYI